MTLEDALNELVGSELESITIFDCNGICLFKGTIFQLRQKHNLICKNLSNGLQFIVGKGYEGEVLQ